MGYMVNGKATLTSTPEIDASIEASLGRFADDLKMTAEERDSLLTNTETPLDRLLSIGSFHEDDLVAINQDGTITHDIVLDEKWYDDSELTLKHLASLGMGIVADFADYEGNAWAYKAELGSCELEYDALVQTSSRRLAELEAKEAQLAVSLEWERNTLVVLEEVKTTLVSSGKKSKELLAQLKKINLTLSARPVRSKWIGIKF